MAALVEGSPMRFFALSGSDVLGKAVADTMDVELDGIEEREFPDSEHKSRPLVSVRNEDVYVLHSLAGDDGRSAADRLIRLLFFIGACKENGAARITAVTPYLAYLRKDQQTQPRDPVNSRYVAEVVEAVGTDMAVTLEAHSVSAFQNAFRCRTLHLDMRHVFAARIAELAGQEPVVLVTPDSGGMRRTRLLQQVLESLTGRPVRLAMMEKHRSAGVLTGDLFAGDVTGAAAFVIDDIIASGGTMLRSAEACRERGAAHVYAVGTHNLMPASSELLVADTVDRIIVSDSVAHNAAVPERGARVETLSCAPLLGEAIQRLHSGGSITRLLNPQR
jgi:ribose-phosphate pyrophosphokinase